MRRPQRRGLALLISAAPLLACSLMGLDDFGVVPCKSNMDCRRAEPQLRPYAAACGAAVCQKDQGLCQWQAHQEECNGIDDDCNGLIDEGLPRSGTSSAPAPFVPAAVAYAIDSESAHTFVAVAVDGGSSQLFTLGESGVSTSELEYESVKGDGCPTASGAASCNFAELALAADAHHRVLASINTYGCAAGQLRVGLLDDKSERVWLGKAKGVPSQDPDTIEFGVDIEDHQGCTGASRAATATTEPIFGATRPAVASLGTEAGGEGALLLWLSASAKDSHAPTANAPATRAPESIPVEALGLVVRAQKPEWLNGTDKGKPSELGYSTSRSAPAVLAVKSKPGQYLVAFPAKQNSEFGIQLLSAQVLGTTLLTATLDFLRVGPAEQVSLALGDPNSGEVGLVWRSGDDTYAELCFTVVSSSGAWPAPQTISKFPTPHPLFAPQILYRSSGFAKTKDESAGGWFLSWVEAVAGGAQTSQSDLQTSKIARVRDDTREVLPQGALYSGGIAQTVLYPSSSLDDASVGYAMIRPAVSGQTHLETVSAWCQ